MTKREFMLKYNMIRKIEIEGNEVEVDCPVGLFFVPLNLKESPTISQLEEEISKQKKIIDKNLGGFLEDYKTVDWTTDWRDYNSNIMTDERWKVEQALDRDTTKAD